MKKNLFYLITSGLCMLSLGIILYSCSNDEVITVDKNEQSLNLVTANGKIIATSIEELKKELSIGIAEKFDTDVDFTITNIVLYDLPTGGYVAVIDYLTANGIKSNVIRSDIDLLIDGNSPGIKTRSEGGSGGGKEYTCAGKTCTSCTTEWNYVEHTVKCYCDSKNGTCSLTIKDV